MMAGNIETRTASARGLIAGLADGDIRIARRGNAWMLVPVSASKAEGQPAPDALIDDLIARGLLEERGGGVAPSRRGRRFVETGPQDRQQEQSPARPRVSDSRSSSTRPPESPLEWLHRRKGPDGQPLIGRAAYEAGERFRAEYTRAGLMPRMSADLTGNIPGKGRRAGSRGPAMVLDAALDARDRVNRAIEAVGNEMSGLVVDVCCHLKSLGDAERERGWPKRSAKVVLDMALSRLARHYGIAEEARGRARAGGIAHWGSEGYRPRIE